MADDPREFRKPKTPPASVRAQTARPLEDRLRQAASDSIPPPSSYEDFEDETQQLHARARNASSNDRAAFHLVRDVRSELKASVERDIRDHEGMTRAMERIDDKVINVDNKVDTVTNHVADVRVDVAEVRGEVQGVASKLDIIMGSIDEERRARIESEKMKALAQLEIMKNAENAKTEINKNAELAKTEVAKNAELAKNEVSKVSGLAAVDETKAAAEHRRKVRYRIVVALLSVFTLLVGLLTKC